MLTLSKRGGQMPRKAKTQSDQSPAAMAKKRGSRGKRASNFGNLMKRERQQLQKHHQRKPARSAAIDSELAEAEKNLKAMDAFLSARGVKVSSMDRGRAKRGERV